MGWGVGGRRYGVKHIHRSCALQLASHAACVHLFCAFRANRRLNILFLREPGFWTPLAVPLGAFAQKCREE